jgi:hypothetical protein
MMFFYRWATGVLTYEMLVGYPVRILTAQN